MLLGAGFARADRGGLGALGLTDLDLQAGHAAIGWYLGGRSDTPRAADVQARWRIGSGDWQPWQSLGPNATEVGIDVTPGEAIAAEVRSLDRRGRATDSSSGRFDIPTTDGIDAVSCVNDIARGDDDDEGERRDRSLSLAGRHGSVDVATTARGGVRLTTPAGLVVKVVLPAAPSSRSVRIAHSAVRYGKASAPTVVATLPAGQPNPCAPPDLTGLLAPALPPESQGAGVDVLSVLPDESAPADFSFPIVVPAGGDIVELGDGFAIRDASGTPIVGVDPPASVDANGNLVDTTAEVDGNVLTVHVDHAGHGFAYPILLDPTFRILSGQLDLASLAAWSPRTSVTSALALGPPALPGACTAYVSRTLLQPLGTGLALRFGGSMDPRDCKIAPLRPIALTLTVCLQKQDAQGRWPSGRGGPCVSMAGPATRIAKQQTNACERYAWYRLWAIPGGLARDPDGKVAPIAPGPGQVGPIAGTEIRCLPLPRVRWAHILAPDGSGNNPSGWHWRDCPNGGQCNDPAGVTLVACKQDPLPTGVYGCRWKYSGFTRAKYSTFFPKSLTQDQVRRLVVFSYMNARFLPDGRWFGPDLQPGWRVRGALVRGQPDVVATAFPDKNLDPAARKIKMVAPGCGTSGGIDVAGGPPNDNFASAQPLTGPSGSVAGTLVDATAQPGEAGGVPTRSVWYCWTAPDTGDIVFDTAGSPPPFAGGSTGTTTAAPVLTVWAGSMFDSLAVLTSDVGGFGYSYALFFAQPGAMYVVSVANNPGTTPDQGSFVLNWHPCACLR